MESAIILAAGKGERLVHGKPYPKPLTMVHGAPLIVRVLRGLELAGIEEVAIVVGYLGEVLKERLGRYRFDLDIRFVENDEFDKPNGTSLLKAKDFVRSPTYLLMSDHLWSPDLIRRLGRFALAGDEAVLGIDFKVTQCVDLADATKVAVHGDRVVQIGKSLTEYDALDTGVFRITPAVIEALEQVDGPTGCSLSQGIAQLAHAGGMRVVDVGDANWVDVDTPLALAHAEALLRRYGPLLRPTTAELRPVLGREASDASSPVAALGSAPSW